MSSTMRSNTSRGMFGAEASQNVTQRSAIGAVMRRAKSARDFEHSTISRDMLCKSASAGSAAIEPAPNTMRTGSER